MPTQPSFWESKIKMHDIVGTVSFLPARKTNEVKNTKKCKGNTFIKVLQTGGRDISNSSG